MRATRILTAVFGAVVAGATAAISLPPPGAGSTSAEKLPDKAVMKSYPVFDAKGRRTGKATWRVSTAGGNCCEVFVAATPTGRLLEFGGTYPVYSDDQGRTWTEIAPAVPSTSRLPNPGPRRIAGGEGAIVMAPGGDIVGIGWDPYSGDRLQAFLYDASDKKWYYQESPLHEAFYDREWIAVAKGPFTIANQTVPWISLVLSNFHRRVVLMSLDGLNYFAPSQRDLDVLRNGTVERYLTVKKDPDLDWMQEHSETSIVPIAEGGALSFDRTSSCQIQLLRKDGSWVCFAPSDFTIEGSLHVDSRGWLHDVAVDADEVIYRISRDGGRTWTARTFRLPGGAVVESGEGSWDFKANGQLGLTAIVAHAKKEDGKHQDMVLRVDTKTGVPRHLDTMFVGNGDYQFTSGLDASTLVSGAKTYRVDFATVAILPNGKLAVGFADKTYDDPAVAVLA